MKLADIKLYLKESVNPNSSLKSDLRYCNWCDNVLSVQGKFEDVKNFVDKYVVRDKSGYDSFSFDKAIPMPESLKHTEAGCRIEECMEYYLSESNPFRNNLSIQSKHSLLSPEDFKSYITAICSSNIQGTYNLHKDFFNKTDEQLEEWYNMGKVYVFNFVNYGHPDWYSWCCDNWGTKWDSSEGSTTGILRRLDNSASVTIYFESAWSPPVPVIESLIERHPELDITLDYFEEGMWFAGEVSSKGSYEVDSKDIEQFAIDKLGYDEDYFRDEEAEDDEDDDSSDDNK